MQKPRVGTGPLPLQIGQESPPQLARVAESDDRRDRDGFSGPQRIQPRQGAEHAAGLDPIVRQGMLDSKKDGARRHR